FVSPSFDAAERQNRLFFYGQDKWRMTPKLTFSYGVRWEIIFPETVNGDGNGGWLDLKTGEIRVAGIGDIGRDGNVETDLGAWAPRLGLAYQLNERTVLRVGYGRSFDIGTFGSIFGHFATQNLPVLSAQDLAPANNFDRVFNLADGPPPPVFPEVPANGRIPLPDGIFARARPDRVRLATVDAWNVTIQHQLSENWSVEIAYVGNKGTHVFSGFDGSTPTVPINQPTIEGFGVLSTNERKPFFHKFGWTQGIDFYCNCHDNNYNSLQLKVIRRFAQGFSLNANYTYGKVLNHDATQILFNDKLGYGPPTFDRTHTLIVSSLWELPFGRGKRWGTGWSRALDLVLGGWQINQTTTASSGRPFTPSYRDCGQDQDVGLCRPSLVGDPTPSDQNRNQWFIPASQVLAQNGQVSGPWQRPQPGTFGTIGRGALRGPQFFQTDMAFFKNIQITERVKAQFRAEAFNVFNVVNLGIPESCIDCNLALAGKITSTEPFTIQRQWRWAIRLEF
ncbi:MAG: TonB-dependent receptor, partial [Acidobacteria bacterium]